MQLSEDGKTLIRIEKGDVKEDGSIEIPQGVTTINGYAAENCHKELTILTLPQGLTSIKIRAFYACYKLKNAIFPEKLTYIGSSAFGYCKDLETLSFPEGLNTIGNEVFIHCISLKTLDLPKELTSIGDSSFANCSKLETVILPKELTSIGKDPFLGCNELKTLILLEGFVSTDSKIFDSFLNVQNVVILSANEIEIKRISQLLPNKLKDKIALKEVYECQEKQLSRILSDPELNPLYLLLDQLYPLLNQESFLDSIPRELLPLIKYYLKESVTYKQARVRIFEEPLPVNLSEMKDYEERVIKIVDQTLKNAKAVSQASPVQTERQAEGLGLGFFQPEISQNLNEPKTLDLVQKP
jgi:hypothetical protein